MNPSDDRIRQLLVETVDRELGSRLEVPAPDDQLRDVGSRTRRARWAVPLAAAAAVVVIAGGSLAVVEATSSKHTNSPVGSSDTAQVTCTGAKGADVGRDRSALIKRAGAVAHGRVTSFVAGNTVSVTIPGAERAAVAGLCTSTALDLAPLIAPAVADPAGTTHNPLAHLGFAVPTTESAYDRLTPAQQAKLRTALSHSDCRPTVRAPLPAGFNDSVHATVACDDGKGSGTRIAALLGQPILGSSQIVNATAQGPAVGTVGGPTEWTVSVTFTDIGTRAFAAFTTAHNTASTTITPQTCAGYGANACSDFLAFTVNGRIVTLPVTQTAITGGTVQIAGTFTRQSAHELAAQLRLGQLPVPLTLTSITGGR